MRALLAVVLAGLCAGQARAVVIGIDFGARFLKIAAIKPGSGIDMVFNEASKRKSSAAVAFNQEDERLLGDDAYNLGPRLPKRTYLYAKTLLGQGLESPAVQTLLRMGYPYDFVVNETTASLAIKQDDATTYFVEELAAFVLSYAKKISEAHVGGTVRDCVLTVPPFWKATERLALLRAADIANLNVLSLVHDGTAVAFKYGFDKEALFVEKPMNVVFLDLGSSALKVTAVEFSATANKKNKTQGAMVVKGVAWDEGLGGRDFDACVGEYLADEFVKAHPGPGKTLRSSERGMGKIRKEAERIKEVLSANNEIPVAIEALHEDTDFRMVMKRAEFERRCEALWPRLETPIRAVLDQAGLAPKDVDRVEVVGGASRIPRIKDTAMKIFERKSLDFSLNGDEACALGAALYAAKMSTSFRLREFGITDHLPFSISARVGGAAQPDDEDDDGAASTKTKVLFDKGSKFPHKKVISLSRSEDFAIEAFLDGEPLSVVNVSGVTKGISAMKAPRREPQGKAKASLTFQLTSSGLLELAKAEVAMDVIEEYDEYVTVNVTDDEAAKEKEGDKAEEGDKEGDKEAEEGVAAEGTEAADGEKKDGEKKEAKSPPPPPPTKREKVTKTAKRVHHVPLASESAVVTPTKPIDASVVTHCVARNKAMLEAEDVRRQDAYAKNRLEAYILDTRDRMSSESEDIEKVTTEKEREELSQLFESTEDWLYGDGRQLPAKDYAEKESELRKKGDPMFYRATEMAERPAAVQAAREKIEKARATIASWAEDKPQILPNETARALELCDNATKWLDEVTALQESRKLTEEPAFASAEVPKKLAAMEKAVRILNKRPKPPPPKPEGSENATEGEGDNATAAEGEEESGDKGADKSGGDGEEASGSGGDGNAKDGDGAKKDEL